MSGHNDNGTSSLRVLRVFLASPSDLSEERRAARAAVDEINKTVARPAGFHVDLIGWEDTLSSAGRPQAIINEDLETCQMFIGMLWARWGTPPDTAGPYSSGFEEEFALASSRNTSKGEPHITLFFKDVEQSKLLDAGPELSKVIAFKDKVIADKKILFESFTEPTTFAQKVRLSVSGFIHKLCRLELSKQAEILSGEDSSKISPNISKNAAEATQEGDGNTATSSKKLIETLQRINLNTLSDVDVAWLRNVAAASGKFSNDNMTVGAHDANLLYQKRNQFKFNSMEVSSLADAGVEAFSDENKPLWSWLIDALENFPSWLCYTTALGPVNRRIGAFRILAALRAPLVEDNFFQKPKLGELWFGDSVPVSVKIAALVYLGEVANVELAPLAEGEFNNNNYVTRQAALEAIVRIRGRSDVLDAARFAITASFDELSNAAMDVIFAGMEDVETIILNDALEHRSGQIKGLAIQILAKRGTLSEAQMRRFFADGAIEARRAAVSAFEFSHRLLSDEEAKNALVLKEVKKSFGVPSNYDAAGQEAYDIRKKIMLSNRSLVDLKASAKTDALNFHDYYMAIASVDFKRSGDQLRADVDDRFKAYWTRFVDALRNKFGVGRDSDVFGGAVQ